MNKKNITIDDLAMMVKRGFDETAKKDEMDKRFHEVDERFHEVDERFNEVDERFNEVDERFNDVSGRFDGVARRFDAIDDRLDRIERLILADHKQRIEKLENEVREIRELLAAK